MDADVLGRAPGRVQGAAVDPGELEGSSWRAAAQCSCGPVDRARCTRGGGGEARARPEHRRRPRLLQHPGRPADFAPVGPVRGPLDRSPGPPRHGHRPGARAGGPGLGGLRGRGRLQGAHGGRRRQRRERRPRGCLRRQASLGLSGSVTSGAARARLEPWPGLGKSFEGPPAADASELEASERCAQSQRRSRRRDRAAGGRHAGAVTWAAERRPRRRRDWLSISMPVLQCRDWWLLDSLIHGVHRRSLRFEFLQEFPFALIRVDVMGCHVVCAVAILSLFPDRNNRSSLPSRV
mmetsp:Transcript_116061/g.308707  ORF Transcript_116061/g.308707 Transcript_116061/m.308707 type:complete len:293 (-) Transcript_116061:171-1049(-)